MRSHEHNRGVYDRESLPAGSKRFADAGSGVLIPHYPDASNFPNAVWYSRTPLSHSSPLVIRFLAMNLRELFSVKRVVILTAILAIGGIVLLVVLRKPPRTPMDRYVPASALAFLEIDSLPGVVDGLTDTKAWHELAPALGLSSQLRQIGFAADLVGRTGVGPEQAVIASRAQLALVVTDIEAEAGGEDASTNIRPHLALLIETHAAADTTSRLLGDLASVLAKRIYGESVSQQSEDYQGTSLLIFQGPRSERQLVAATAGSVALVANNRLAVKSCLDAIAGRASRIADEATLKQMRSTVDRNASVFAYVTETGIAKLVTFGSALVSTRFTSDADRIDSIASLFGHMSKQTTAGLFYGAAFESEGVTERYMTALRPQVAERLAQALKPAPLADPAALRFIPRSAEDFASISVEAAGELPERVLKELSPQLDIVAGLALREFVLSFRRQLGLQAGDSLGDSLGSDIVFVRFSESEPTAMLLRVKNRALVSPVVERYLTIDHSKVSLSEYNGQQLAVGSTRPDGRAAAFVKEFLLLGTRDQIVKMIDAEASADSMISNNGIKEIFGSRPTGASIVSYRPEAREAGEMMLAISHLTRVTDGASELLEQEPIKQAMGRLQPSVSFTEFRVNGIYVETKSAVGNFGLLSSLVSNEK